MSRKIAARVPTRQELDRYSTTQWEVGDGVLHLFSRHSVLTLWPNTVDPLLLKSRFV